MPADADAEAFASADAAAPARADAGRDASTSTTACRLAYGPEEQPFRGPAVLRATKTELSMIANDSGRPRVFAIPIAPPMGAPPTPRKPSAFVSMRWPPCDLAGSVVYCQAAGGTLTRTTLGSSDTKNIGKSRSGTRIAAAALGAGHAAVASLEMHRTTEGDMLQAFVTLDDHAPVRLSDEGAGATTLRMAPRGDGAVVVYVDARTAMAPVHARTLGVSPKGDLELGEDHVVMVGGPPERGLDLGLARAGGALFALLPMPRESLDFGMAAVEIFDPPRDDVPATWSLYPNGLDPAPVAATLDDAGAAYVVRARPKDATVGASRVLELGRLDAKAAFSSLGTIAEGVHVTDVAVVVDAHRSLWILYGDTHATWLERRVCP